MNADARRAAGGVNGLFMSNEIQSILAVIDRDGVQAKRVAAKAASLAHMAGAHLELFLCDAEVAFSLQHQYEARAAERAKELCLIESRRYLETLQRRLAASEVEISLSVACESPLYESIVRAVRRSRPGLVVRGAAPGEPLDPNTWELVAECPAPLLLTRGRAWKARPVIAAAIDVSPGESRELTRAILRSASSFASTAGGAVEIVHAGGVEDGSPTHDACRMALAERARDAGLEGAECHLIAGEPAQALREFCARCDFDLIVLGALTHRKTLAALVGTLTGRLIESVESDFLLVKSGRAGPSAP